MKSTTPILEPELNSSVIKSDKERIAELELLVEQHEKSITMLTKSIVEINNQLLNMNS